MTSALPPAPPLAFESIVPLDMTEILRFAFSALAPSDHLARLLDHVEGRE